MEITFNHPSSEERSVEVSEQDLENLRKCADACIVDRMRVIGLNTPYIGYEQLLSEMCERYGVDVGSKLAVTNFLSACLKPEASILEPRG